MISIASVSSRRNTMPLPQCTTSVWTNRAYRYRDRVDNKKPLSTLMHRLPTLRRNTVIDEFKRTLTRFACLIKFEKVS